MRSSFSFSIDIITRPSKTDQTIGYIYARVTVLGKSVEIALREKIHLADWDRAREMVKGKSAEVKGINIHIDNVRFRIKEQYHALLDKRVPISAEGVKQAYYGVHEIQSKGHTVGELLDYHTKMTPGQLTPGTLKNYVTTDAYVRNFIKAQFGKEDYYLVDLNYEFMTELEHFIRNNPVKKHDPCVGNGVMKHLERFKKMVKWARQLKWISIDPFVDYKLALKRYRRVKLDFRELEKIEQARFETPRLEFVQDLFLFSCYTGLAYADVMALKPSHFEWGMNGKVILKIYREKSDELSAIPVLSLAAAIIEKYKDHPMAVKKGTVFPFVSNQEVNRSLKIIGEICGIQKYMSFHLARHTFATLITLKNGVPIETVSKMLGHRKITTTEIYAVVDDEKLLDDMLDVDRRLLARKGLSANSQKREE